MMHKKFRIAVFLLSMVVLFALANRVVFANSPTFFNSNHFFQPDSSAGANLIRFYDSGSDVKASGNYFLGDLVFASNFENDLAGWESEHGYFEMGNSKRHGDNVLPDDWP